jgi:amino acid transporter
MLFTALSYATMSRAFPLAGSVYAYAQRGLGEVAGFFAGWLILLDYIVIPGLLYLLAGIALRPILAQVPQWAWLLVFVAANAAVNLAGVRLTARVNRLLLWVELFVLTCFLVAGALALHAGMGAGGSPCTPSMTPRLSRSPPWRAPPPPRCCPSWASMPSRPSPRRAAAAATPSPGPPCFHSS